MTSPLGNLNNHASTDLGYILVVFSTIVSMAFIGLCMTVVRILQIPVDMMMSIPPLCYDAYDNRSHDWEFYNSPLDEDHQAEGTISQEEHEESTMGMISDEEDDEDENIEYWYEEEEPSSNFVSVGPTLSSQQIPVSVVYDTIMTDSYDCPLTISP
jgi:hypothetical protein